ncbi:MAG: anhydro-N-acetylmuramic acid kinase, partial [Candidatus Roseilinea sp.]|uniref:anhydro-N-acetylmuramic acid kinase n=1 Tax=Candidatus Roseilinea sp. TaxID=2838777 RepID=UPI004049BA2A
MLVLGLMSGTSVDGIDTALVELDGAPPALRWRLIQHTSSAYPPDTRAEIFACFDPRHSSAERLCALNFAIGRAFAEAALACVRAAGLDIRDVQLIGSHGQTIWHIPEGERASTLQLGEPAVIAEMTGCPVVAHFRARDMAAGGQGAPLVAYADVLLLTHPQRTRTALNIGGIANFTYLPPSALAPAEAAFAFDTGPGNMLIDDAVVRLTHGAQVFDRDGRIALAGKISPALLDELMSHPYLRQAPPKTTGRELFGAQFGARVWARAQALGLRGEDVVATLTAFTAASIARAHRDFLPRPVDEVIVSGGGVRNPVLMDHLRKMLAPACVRASDELGLPSAAKEALAFAVLAYESYHRRPGNLPAATGARHAVILGALTPVARQADALRAPSLPDKQPATESVHPATVNIDTLD